jgi:glycosyltransferase involved in cell wall biosynthesis
VANAVREDHRLRRETLASKERERCRVESEPMNVVLTVEHHYHRTPDGAVWTQAVFAYPTWARYLAVFDHVRVVARVRESESVPQDWIRADGEGVSFAAVPDYLGPWQYLMRAGQVQRLARNAVGIRDAVILLFHGHIACCIEPMLRRTGHPFGVYINGDPYDAFSPGSVDHPLRPLFRWWFTRLLKRQVAAACAVAYISEVPLRRRYPPAPGTFSTTFAHGIMPAEAFVSVPRPLDTQRRALTLIMVGTLSQLYKCPDVLIDAVAACVREGLDLRLVVVGDGKHRRELQARAEAVGLGERVCFKGQLTAGDAVRAQLDRADLFVLPSRAEALGRAIVEAMARALPCIGSTVGGIPELLLPEDMVFPGDATALARKIREVATDPARMARMSARNLEKAKQYRDDILADRRIAFYRYVREKTEKWLRRQSA